MSPSFAAMIRWEHSGGIKVKRAEKHIRDLETEIEAFEKSDPYGLWSDQDEKTGEVRIRARIARQPEIAWGALAGDAIHNLRSSLDVLWHNAMYPDRNAFGDRGSGFVIHDSPESFKASCKREVRSSRKAAVEVYRRLQPYKGGNDSLYRLHRLDIADKHHVLLPILTAVQSKRVQWTIKYSRKIDAREILNAALTKSPRIIRAPEDGAILRTITGVPGVPAEVNLDAEFTFHVALDQGEPTEAEPIVTTLNSFVDLVRNVVAAFIDAGAIT